MSVASKDDILEINIYECIKFVNYNVNIIAANAGRYNRNAFACEYAGYGMELAALYIAFY